MTKLIIELPSWEVNKNDLAEIANKMQAIELSFNDLINDIPELKNLIILKIILLRQICPTSMMNFLLQEK